MVQETRRARFQLEASQSIEIRRIRGGQNLDGDVPADPGIVRAIHFAHASGADELDDLMRAETRTRVSVM